MDVRIALAVSTGFTMCLLTDRRSPCTAGFTAVVARHDVIDLFQATAALCHGDGRLLLRLSRLIARFLISNNEERGSTLTSLCVSI
jgi:hypothetical protein